MSEKPNNRSTIWNRNIWSGVLFGIGLVAFLDETVFHQLLHWHHFYDKTTTSMGLVSDGLFHAFSWFSTIGGLFLVADLKRQNAFVFKRWWGGSMVGGGAFQLYDGTIQHKIMRIHQIRYVDNVIIYDWIWNILAVIMIIVGALFIRRSRKEMQQADRTAYDGA
jgi:uncharacterized membrane protein